MLTIREKNNFKGSITQISLPDALSVFDQLCPMIRLAKPNELPHQ